MAKSSSQSLTVPVIEDARQRVVLPFSVSLKIGTPFAFIMDQAFQAADRYVFVHGEPPNPIKFIEDWVENVKTAFNLHWTVDPRRSRYYRNSSLRLTDEHYRQGEIVAMGIAIQYLAERLQVPRQRFFFISGDDARPDFAVRLKRYHRNALMLLRRRFTLEVRSRNAARGYRNLTKADCEDLLKKKIGTGGTLAVYCFYGPGEHRDKVGNQRVSHTRIHVADPPGDDGHEVSDLEIARSAVHHYLRLTSQIGLWHHRDHLLLAEQSLAAGELAGPPMAEPRVPLGITREVEGRRYHGREFNELIEIMSRRPTTIIERDANRRNVRRRVEAGNFGTLIFRGLNLDVLKLIEGSEWLALADFQDVATRQYRVEHWVRSDGLFRSEREIVRGSQEADDLQAQLRTALE